MTRIYEVQVFASNTQLAYSDVVRIFPDGVALPPEVDPSMFTVLDCWPLESDPLPGQVGWTPARLSCPSGGVCAKCVTTSCTGGPPPPFMQPFSTPANPTPPNKIAILRNAVQFPAGVGEIRVAADAAGNPRGPFLVTAMPNPAAPTVNALSTQTTSWVLENKRDIILHVYYVRDSAAGTSSHPLHDKILVIPVIPAAVARPVAHASV